MKCVHAVKGMSFHAFHGVLEVERELGQVFLVDAAVEFEAALDDNASKTEPLIRDADVYEIARNLMMETKFRSISLLAGKIAHDLMTEYPKADRATVSIRRKQLFIPGNVDLGLAEASISQADCKAKAGKK
jgi:dihydroneopterin aldolase